MDSDEGSKRLFIAIPAIAIITTLFLIVAFVPAHTITYERPEKQEIAKEEATDPHIHQLLEYLSYCESRHRQFDEDGRVLRGAVNSKDVGRWQINERYWLEKARELGYDIYTERGNRRMAHYILTEGQGIEAWSASAECLEKNFGLLLDNHIVYGN